MQANGPAIKGGCVTWRSHPATGPGTLAGKVVPVARQVWRAFCRHGTNFIECRRGRGTSLINGREFVPVDEVGKRHWRSVAVQIVSEPEICQGAEFYIASRCAYPGAGLELVLVSGSESCKKHDKQLTFIVRVISRCLFILQGCLMYLRKYQSRSRDFFFLLSKKSRIVSIISDTLIRMGMKYIFSKERTSPRVIAPIEVMPANTAYKLVL